MREWRLTERERQIRARYEAAYRVQDRLYSKYHLEGRKRALSELLPLLVESERRELAGVMREAGLMWRGFTDAESGEAPATSAEAEGSPIRQRPDSDL